MPSAPPSLRSPRASVPGRAARIASPVLAALALAFASAIAAPAPARTHDRHPADPPGPSTVAEASDFRRTSSSDEVEAFLAAIAHASPRAATFEIGRSAEDRPITAAIVADPPIASLAALEAERTRRDGRLLVLLVGNIHAGEVAGKEALLALLRELAGSAMPADEDADATAPDPIGSVLERLVVAIVPNLNPDGNDRFSPDHRPGQIGPDEMGTRANAAGLDLNRDWTKLAAPETRTIVRFLNRFDPQVIVDTHTTNGSHHRYPLTFQGPKHPASDPELVAFVRDAMLPEIAARMREEDGYETFFYGNFAAGHTRWTTYPAGPRYGTAYRGLRGRVTILSEAYAYADYETRIDVSRVFCRRILESAAVRADEIARLCREVDRRAVEAGRDGAGEVAVRSEVRPFPERVTILGWQEYDEAGARVGVAGPPYDEDEPRDYEVEFWNDFVAAESIRRPRAYLFAAEHAGLAARLAAHGIVVRELRETLELPVERIRILGFARAERDQQGVRPVQRLETVTEPGTTRVEAGAFVIDLEQPLGTLAAVLLEPRSEDGLTEWTLPDELLAPGGLHPVMRLHEDLPLLLADAPAALRPARTLAPGEPDPRAPRPLDFARLDDRGTAPDLSGRASGPTRWIDDEHFEVRRAGDRWRVHAATGRMEPIPFDADAVAARLAAAPGIEEDDARRLAGRFAALDPDSEDGVRGLVFEHADDLWHAGPRGEHPRRLTSTPEPEEVFERSPDGAFVGFVRGDDLWTVDVATGTERRLTTESGGEDGAIRNGKASWVYFEELFGRSWKAWWWSPDGRTIAFLRTDSAAVPRYTLLDEAADPPRIESYRWPAPGDRNPHVEVFTIPRAGGAPRRVALDDYDDGAFLVPSVGWTPDGRVRLVVQDRVQSWADLLVAQAGGGVPERRLRLESPAWLEAPRVVHDLADGSFVLEHAADGWIRLEHRAKDGTLVRPLVEGEWSVRGVLQVHEPDDLDAAPVEILFSAPAVDADRHPRERHLHRLQFRADGAGEVGIARMTPERGWHRTTPNPSGTMFVDEWSTVDTPSRIVLRNRAGAPVRTLDANPVRDLETVALGEVRLFDIAARDGRPLSALLVLPPGRADDAAPLPTWVMTYAGPDAMTVRDTWSGGRASDHALAAAGVAVLRVDPWAASGRGPATAFEAHHRLGLRAVEDLEDAVDRLVADGIADPRRIGLSGHSYGGFITALAMTRSDRFASGIAGAPVTDWRDYDSIYTERYMGTPQQNPGGYRETSPVTHAADLHGRLLLVHGTMDDNVHPRNALRLVSALQRAGKDFRLMLYPGFRHGIGGRHYRDLQRSFMLEHLRPGDGGATSGPSDAGSPDDRSAVDVPGDDD